MVLRAEEVEEVQVTKHQGSDGRSQRRMISSFHCLCLYFCFHGFGQYESQVPIELIRWVGLHRELPRHGQPLVEWIFPPCHCHRTCARLLINLTFHQGTFSPIPEVDTSLAMQVLRGGGPLVQDPKESLEMGKDHLRKFG